MFGNYFKGNKKEEKMNRICGVIIDDVLFKIINKDKKVKKYD